MTDSVYIISASKFKQFFFILSDSGKGWHRYSTPWVSALCWCRSCAFYWDYLQVHRLWRHTQTCGKCRIDGCWALGLFLQYTIGFQPMFVCAGLFWIEHGRPVPYFARRLHNCCVQIWNGPGVAVESVLGIKCYWAQCCRLVWLWLADSNKTPAPWNVRWTLLQICCRR